MECFILKIKKFIFFFSVIVLFFLGSAGRSCASGASLFLSPASGIYNIGDQVKISVRLNSAGQNINAAEGTINFDPNILSVIDVSKTSSMFNLWTLEPSFSNSQGNIMFGGGTTNSFNGASGVIFTVTLKAKANGRSGVNFSSGSILASDGKGTNILSSMIGGSYAVQPQVTTIANAEQAYIPPKNTPERVDIVSSTHPDQNKWYANSNPKFSWGLPDGIVGVKVLLDQFPQSMPVKYYNEPPSEKQLEGVKDGVWYFHLQLCNRSGCGGVAHYKVQIDTVKPEIFQIKIQDGEKTTNSAPNVVLEAEDKVSGLDYYQLKVGNNDWVEIKDAQYTLPVLGWGKYAILAKAVDGAGNSALSVAEVEIVPLDPPKITDYPREAISGSYLSLKGTALPELTVRIFIQSGGKMEEVQAQSDKNGNWSYIYDKFLEAGIYSIWAETIDLKGSKSTPSDKITFIVSSPAFFRVGKILIEYLTVSIILLVLILIMVLGLIWALTMIKQKVKKLRKGTTKAEQSLFRAFKHLEKEVGKEVALIDGDPRLSKKEKKVSENLKRSLKSAEKFIGKEIKDIEKELTKY